MSTEVYRAFLKVSCLPGGKEKIKIIPPTKRNPTVFHTPPCLSFVPVRVIAQVHTDGTQNALKGYPSKRTDYDRLMSYRDVLTKCSCRDFICILNQTKKNQLGKCELTGYLTNMKLPSFLRDNNILWLYACVYIHTYFSYT